MTKPTREEAEGWLSRMIDAECGEYNSDMARFTRSLLKAIPEPEPEWGPWIGWNGGECPVDGGDIVEVASSNGGKAIDKAYVFVWVGGLDTSIIAYRVKQSPPEPEIWYRVKGGTPQLFQSKRDLKIVHSGLPDEFIEKVEVRVVK